MRARRTSLVLVLLLSLAACAPVPGSTGTGTLPVGSSRHSLDVNGTGREFVVYRPPAAAADGYPVVVMLHGGLGSAQQAERSYSWDDVASSQGFVVLYPDGLDRAWNAGSCCGAPARTAVDDVGFITAALAEVGRMVRVDPRRIYVTGMSNGAMMAYRLACETDAFAAVAPVAGDQMVECGHRSPASLLHIHGTADAKVPLDGSPGSGVGKVDGPPVQQVVDGWLEADRCGPLARTSTGEVTTATASCAQGRAVELVTVAGAGHQWPGSGVSTYPGADRPSAAFSATDLIWAFFSAHPKP